MKLKRSGFFLVLLICCFNRVWAETQYDLNKAACDQLTKADDKLNNVYQKIMAKYKDDKIFISHFVTAQKKWIDFRDAYVASMYIPQYTQTYGSILPMCQCYFLEQITTQRMKQISAWIDGVTEGDVCTGSIKN